MKRIYFLLALCNAFACLYSQDIQVAILEPVGTTNEVTTMHRSMVRGEMVKAIGRQNGYAAFNRADIDQIMKEQNFQQSGMVDDATRKRLGAMQGVDCVCITKITKEGNNYYLEANLVDIESGQISNPASQYVELQGGSLANMLAACEKLAAELVGAQSIASNSTTSTQSYAASTTGQAYQEQQYSKGLDYYNAENYVEAHNILKPLAEQGYAPAQFIIGECYYYGEGVPEDESAAVSWYRKAAEQGYAPAQNSLGYCYYYGNGVTEDESAAVSWYRKAAEQGYASAQYSLGDCYYSGNGVTQDYYAAVSWYRKAAEQGYSSAQYYLGYCYEYGKGVTQDYYAAVSWYRKAAEQGYSLAQYCLGDCYEKGKGVTENIDEAITWYKKAADQGHSGAKERLEDIEFFRADDNSSSSINISSSSSSSTQKVRYTSGEYFIGNNYKILGSSNTVIGNNNKIIGNNNDIKGNNNKAVGNNNRLEGDNNKAVGDNNRLKGKNNDAFGSNNIIL